MMSISTMKILARKIRLWRAVARQRRELRGVSDHILKDIGLSRADAIREANRHFWDHSPFVDSSLRRYQRSRDTADRPQIKCRGKSCFEV